MHYTKKKKLAENVDDDDDCAAPFCQALGGEVERVAMHLGTHIGLLFIPTNAQRPPDIARARKFFLSLDPLVSKIVSIRGERVRVEWTIPLPVNGVAERSSS
jgi:hypothetical protein